MLRETFRDTVPPRCVSLRQHCVYQVAVQTAAGWAYGELYNSYMIAALEYYYRPVGSLVQLPDGRVFTVLTVVLNCADFTLH